MVRLQHWCACRRSRQHQLVVETSRHHYGGRLVSLHSTVQLVNSSSLQLQLGCCVSLEQTGDPVVLDTLGPGESMWLPLQVRVSSQQFSLQCSLLA